MATTRRGTRSRRRRQFRVGDRVSWNSEAGRLRGAIRKKVTAPMRFKTYTGSALRRLS